MSAKNKTILYLDHAATTYLDPDVEKAMRPYWRKQFGNPSSIYDLGMNAKFAMDEARKKIANLIGARENEIIFTAGGTESINLAIFGSVRSAILAGNKKPHIITTSIEHHAVLESCRALEKEGIKVTYLPVNEFGFVDAAKLVSAVRRETVFVSVIYANNEIGTIQNIAEIGKRLRKKNPRVIFHTDACQAPGSLSINVTALNVDLMSLNGSKIYGPKQTGCLYVRRGITILPLVYGGGQEKGLRSGTENVPGIVGFAAALELAEKSRIKESAKLRKLRNALIREIKVKINNSLLNGPDSKSDSVLNPTRLPNNVNFSFPGVDGEALMLYLNAQGIEVSTGSACSSTSVDPSHVISAIGRSAQDARSSIRITFGKMNSEKDITVLMRLLPGLVAELRRVEWK